MAFYEVTQSATSFFADGGTFDSYLTSNGWTRVTGSGGVASRWTTTCPITSVTFGLHFTSYSVNGGAAFNLVATDLTTLSAGYTFTWNSVTNSGNEANHRIKMAVRPGFLYLAVEGPRAGETGAYDAYGSGRAGVIVSTITPYEKLCPDEVIPLFLPITNNQAVGRGFSPTLALTDVQLGAMRPLVQDSAAFGERPQTILSPDGDIFYSPILCFNKNVGYGGFIGTMNNVYFGSQNYTQAGDPTGTEFHGYYGEVTGEDSHLYQTVYPYMNFNHANTYSPLGWTYNGTQPMSDTQGGPVIIVRKD